jgi:hypothetical protein
VDDQDVDTGQLATNELGQVEACVDVAADGGYRGDRAEAGEHVGRADVTRVEDVLDVCERLDHLGTEEPVRVGDQPDQHPLAAVRAS